MRLRFVTGSIGKKQLDTKVSVKCKPTEHKNSNNYSNKQYFSKTDITLLIARIMKTESYKKMITFQHLHDSWRERVTSNITLSC